MVLLCALSTSAAAADFERSGWEESEALLRERGGEPFTEIFPGGLKTLLLNDRVADLDTFVVYFLLRDNLVQTRYLFAQNHMDPNLYLPEYARVEEVLRQRYGQPSESGEIRRDGHLMDLADPARMIAVGELVLMSRWETEDSVITHVLQGKYLDVDHEIHYHSRNYEQVRTPDLDRLIPPRKIRF